MTASAEFNFGASSVRINEDVLVVRPDGDLRLELAHAVIQFAQQLQDRHGHYFIHADLYKAGTIEPNTRRLLAQFGVKHPPLAIALSRVSVVARGVNALLFGAMNIIGRRQNWVQFAHEEEAVAWIAKERQRILFPTK